MTTQCEVQCYGLPRPRAETLAQTIVARVDALVQKFNFHAADSWLNRTINQRRDHQQGGNRVQLDAETAAILQTVRTHSAQLKGVFDITVGTFAARLKQATTLAEATAIRQEYAPFTGLERWQLEDDTLLFDNPHTRFDLGGVIKEFAVDQCLELARQAGASAALVNFGGDLNTFGTKPGGERFVAAVQDPLDAGRMLFALDLENQALTTSGHYARKRQLADGELSHVHATAASTPSAAWLSATVVSRSTLVSGIYSTSLLLNPALDLPERVFAVTVDAQRRIHQLPRPA